MGPSSENMRRSFRTPESGVRSTQGFTLGWYALPLRGNQNNAFTIYTSSGEGGEIAEDGSFPHLNEAPHIISGAHRDKNTNRFRGTMW
jgi:hypothetical protein